TKILFDVDNCKINLGQLLPIWGEKSLIFQVFSNVIGNAIKYSSMQSDPIVDIYSYKGPDTISYVIKDNGIGIPTEFIKNIYNVFRRANNTENFSGTGVGLSLVKRIMEKLGGEINIESTLDKGTTITLLFPNLDK